MSSSTIFFFSALLFTAATASPLATRGPTPGCHPSFAGVTLTLTTSSGSLSWSAKAGVGNPLGASSSSSKFFFQQNGFPVVDYTVKIQENNNFALELTSGKPSLGNTDLSGSNANQKWMVDCKWCTSSDISLAAGNVAGGCSISSTTTKDCVTSKTNPMTLAACDNSGDQLFEISAVK